MMEALRKRALYGLRACVPKTEEDEKIGCADCPYGCSKADAVRLPAQMIEDIRAVLENMEPVKPILRREAPRVLTLEEVLHLKFDDVVFFEMQVTGVVISAIVIDVVEHMPDGDIGLIQFRHIQEPINNADLEYYGKTWRCWTSRPTDEQREALKWERVREPVPVTH